MEQMWEQHRCDMDPECGSGSVSNKGVITYTIGQPLIKLLASRNKYCGFWRDLELIWILNLGEFHKHRC